LYPVLRAGKIAGVGKLVQLGFLAALPGQAAAYQDFPARLQDAKAINRPPLAR